MSIIPAKFQPSSFKTVRGDRGVKRTDGWNGGSKSASLLNFYSHVFSYFTREGTLRGKVWLILVKSHSVNGMMIISPNKRFDLI